MSAHLASVAVVSLALFTLATGCGATSHDQTSPDSEGECHTAVAVELIVVHVSMVGDDAPAMLIETGWYVEGVAQRVPIEGEVEVHRRDEVIVVRADDPSVTQSLTLCRFDESGFRAGYDERDEDVSLAEIGGGMLHTRCRFGVTVAECHGR